MCGIAGIINYQEYDLNVLKRTLFHRGPDEQSIYTDKNLALIHTRLAIQDIEHGKQPFHFNNYSIIFNGEIYNHLELREKLAEFTFQTTSDTETLLYLYIKFGEEMFTLLDGMFAFCIYNKKDNYILLAKDRVGKKPLYYIHHSNSFIFVSELNALKSLVNLKIDEEAIECYLRAGFIYKPFTPYKNVTEIEPGSFTRIDLESLELKSIRYYNILHQYYNKNTLSLENAIEQTQEKLLKSVKDRLLSSDVSVGVFLSGGIDSNLIVAMAAQVTRDIKTFTVKFDGLFDESHLAKLTAAKYGTQHTELTIETNVTQDIEMILARYGEPFMDSSAVPSYYIAKEARKNVGVVLNGDGADELFAGYRRYVPIANNFLGMVKLGSRFIDYLPKSNIKHSKYNYVYRLLRMAAKKDLDFYLSATSDIYEDVISINKTSIIEKMEGFVKETLVKEKLSSLSKMLYLDYNLLLYSDLLVKMDIATMANSLEARSPFLSKYMLSFAPTLPDKYKINRFKTKFILRELAKKFLPIELINQPKRGFEVPLKKWVEVDLKESIFDNLSPGCYSEKYVKRDDINQLLHSKKTVSAEKRAKMLWSLFCLEIWYKNENKFRQV